MHINAVFKLLLVSLLLWSCNGQAYGQLFGSPRHLGQPFQPRQGPGAVAQATQGAGEVQGNERFLRSNRRRGAFVGSDRNELRSFVGAQQGRATGSAVASTVGIQPDVDRSSQINQPLPSLGKDQPYFPKLAIDVANAPAGIRLAGELKRELENPDHFSRTNRFEVSVVNRTATLRGVVADARERDLAESLVSFEPGISVVRNELLVARDESNSGLQSAELADQPPPLPLPPDPQLELPPPASQPLPRQ